MPGVSDVYSLRFQGLMQDSESGQGEWNRRMTESIWDEPQQRRRYRRPRWWLPTRRLWRHALESQVLKVLQEAAREHVPQTPDAG